MKPATASTSRTTPPTLPRSPFWLRPPWSPDTRRAHASCSNTSPRSPPTYCAPGRSSVVRLRDRSHAPPPCSATTTKPNNGSRPRTTSTRRSKPRTGPRSANSTTPSSASPAAARATSNTRETSSPQPLPPRPSTGAPDSASAPNHSSTRSEANHEPEQNASPNAHWTTPKGPIPLVPA